MRVRDYIEISVATYKPRFQTFLRSFESIYSNDNYYSVNINGDDDECLAFSEKLLGLFGYDNLCVMTHSLDLNYGDRAKFKPLTYFGSVEKRPDYFLTVDDDIIYPRNYVDRMTELCSRYGGIPIGVHGITIFNKDTKLSNYFSDRLVTHFSAPSSQKFVNCLGTGTLCFSPQAVNIEFSFFEEPNMCDCYFAVYCQKNNIPMICIDRQINWLIELSDGSPSLWSSRGNGSKQTKIINQFKNWRVFKCEALEHRPHA